MINEALNKVTGKIRFLKNRAKEEPVLVLEWLVRNAVVYNDGKTRSRKIRKQVDKFIGVKKDPNLLIAENEDHQYAVKALTQIGYPRKDAVQMILEIAEENPDMSTEDLIAYVLKHRRTP